MCYCLKFETPPTWRARSPYLYPPSTGFPYRRLLRFARLRWRYSNPPPYGLLTLSSKPHLAHNPSVPTSQKTQYFYCCIWIRCPRDVFTAPLLSNGCCADHRKHRSSLAVPLLRSCLVLRDPIYN
jgi:hypothetical protein